MQPCVGRLDERERRWIKSTSQEVLGRWKTVIPEQVAATDGVYVVELTDFGHDHGGDYTVRFDLGAVG